MTLLRTRHGQGDSTKLISARIQYCYIEFADKTNLMLARLTTKALEMLIHDIQTDHWPTDLSPWMLTIQSAYANYKIDWRGSKHTMLRMRMDFLDYLHMNDYRVNTTINFALQIFMDRIKTGTVTQADINRMTKRGYVPYELDQIKALI